MKVYPSAFSKTNKILMGAVFVILIACTVPVLFIDNDLTGFLVVLLINLACIALLIWIILSTKYTLVKNELKWRSGPFYGKIDVRKIRKIEHHKGVIIPTFMKAGLSEIGLIITYNQFDDLYISPENCETFIADLQKIKPEIEVIELKGK